MSDVTAPATAAPVIPAGPTTVSEAAEKIAAAVAAPSVKPTSLETDRATAQARADAYKAATERSPATDSPFASPVAEPSTPIAPAAPTEPAKKPELKSAAFAKEAQFRREQRALKQREAEIAAKAKQLEEQFAQFESAKAIAKKNPEAWLKAAGLEYNDVVAAKLANSSPVDPAVAAREAAQAELRAFKEEQAKTQAQSEWARFSRDAIDEVRKQSERFELINYYGFADQIPALYAKTYRETGEAPTVDSVAQYLESQLEEQLPGILNTKKAKARLAPVVQPPAPAPVVPAPVAEASQAPQAQPEKKESVSVPKTISTNLTPAAGSVAPKVVLTMEERKARAIARLSEN